MVFPVHLEPRLARRAAGVAAVTAAAGVITVASRSGWIGLSHLAATPNAIAQGKVWLLLTSGVVADRPWLPSLLGFAIVAFAALSVARVRVVVLAALAGQVLATLAVYGFFGLARTVDHGAFVALENTPDIGLSAIIAALDRRRRTGPLVPPPFTPRTRLDRARVHRLRADRLRLPAEPDSARLRAPRRLRARRRDRLLVAAPGAA